MMTPREVADNLKVSEITIKDWLRSGKMKGIKIGGKLWRIRRKDAENFIEEYKERRVK